MEKVLPFPRLPKAGRDVYARWDLQTVEGLAGQTKDYQLKVRTEVPSVSPAVPTTQSQAYTPRLLPADRWGPVWRTQSRPGPGSAHRSTGWRAGRGWTPESGKPHNNRGRRKRGRTMCQKNEQQTWGRCPHNWRLGGKIHDGTCVCEGTCASNVRG